MYLLDTNVLSELCKRRSGKIHAAVEAWAGAVDQAELHLSVITIMEVELGIALLERRHPQQANVLRLWLHNKVMPTFAGRILPAAEAVPTEQPLVRSACAAGHEKSWNVSRTRR